MRLVLGLVVASALALVASDAFAQRGLGRYVGRLAEPNDYDGSFHFCRGWFRQALNGDGGGWQADWPYADHDAVRHRIFTGHPAGMPIWGMSSLTLREIDAVTAYVVEVLRTRQ